MASQQETGTVTFVFIDSVIKLLVCLLKVVILETIRKEDEANKGHTNFYSLYTQAPRQHHL